MLARQGTIGRESKLIEISGAKIFGIRDLYEADISSVA